MARNPTDREVLRCIYDTYYNEYVSFNEHSKYRITKTFVPLDLNLIGRKLSTDPDLIFGRLHYHLQSKFGSPGGNKDIQFFQIEIQLADKADRHVVNFPLLDSVLAELDYEHGKFLRSWRLSISSLVIAAIALAVSIGTNITNLAKLAAH